MNINVGWLSAFFVPSVNTLIIICSLFSMEGDFAPMVELAELRKKHSFLLVIDDVSMASRFN